MTPSPSRPSELSNNKTLAILDAAQAGGYGVRSTYAASFLYPFPLLHLGNSCQLIESTGCYRYRW
jgi:hypothetical protein